MTIRFVAVGGSGVGLRFEVARIPGAGETVLASGLTTINGGKASNQAIGAARLGATSHIVTAVGRDAFADIARGVWAAHHVSDEGVIEIDSAPTMVGTVVVAADGENVITVAPGALGAVTPEAIRTRARLIASADVCLVSLEIATDAAAEALRIARDAGVLTVLNPAPAPGESELVATLLASADWVTPNEHEARGLTGEADPGRAAMRLLDAGVNGVVVTLGADGSLLADRKGIRRIPSRPVRRLGDTSGAGDAFNTAFALGLAAGVSPLDAAELGADAGARICAGVGFVEALDEWEGFSVPGL